MVDIDVFEDVPLFALLDAEERQVLARHVEERRFAAGETIFKTGDPAGTPISSAAARCTSRSRTSPKSWCSWTWSGTEGYAGCRRCSPRRPT